MKASALQEFLRSLGGSLAAVGVPPKSLDDLRTVAHALAPLADMDLEQFADGTSTANSGHVRNPQRLLLSNAQQVSDVNSPGVGPDGVFRDPWGNPYIISLDMNFDNSTFDGFYSTLRKSKRLPTLLPEISQSVLVWSFGPNGTVDATATGLSDTGKGLGANKDNILSWDM